MFLPVPEGGRREDPDNLGEKDDQQVETEGRHDNIPGSLVAIDLRETVVDDVGDGEDQEPTGERQRAASEDFGFEKVGDYEADADQCRQDGEMSCHFLVFRVVASTLGRHRALRTANVNKFSVFLSFSRQAFCPLESSFVTSGVCGRNFRLKEHKTEDFMYVCQMAFSIRSILSSAGILFCIAASAQRVTVSGYVKDAKSGEPLSGAIVIDAQSSVGTVTADSGFYSLSFESGERSLTFSCIGFHQYVDRLDIRSDMTLNVSLNSSHSERDAAGVTPEFDDTGLNGTRMSAVEVRPSQIKFIPALGGEADAIKALQLLPGVQSGAECTTAFYVRGGGADENLVLMDGVPLYNVNHMFGLFSVFNADALKNVTLYKGCFPARFGDHLSSVLDFSLNDGNEREIHGNLSLGLISSKFNLEGPIVKGRTTFNVSARRTYLDLLSKPILARIGKLKTSDGGNSVGYGGGYYFYDINAKVTHRLLNGDRLSISFYGGDDNADVDVDKESTSTAASTVSESTSGALSGTEAYDSEIDETFFSWQWGNLLSSLRWTHALGPKAHLTALASYTRYRSCLDVGNNMLHSVIQDGREIEREGRSTGLSYNSLINDLSGTAAIDWCPSPCHSARFGAVCTFHRFNPGVISTHQVYDSTTGADNSGRLTKSYGDSPVNAHEAALYGEDNWTLAPSVKANLGLRTSIWSVGGKTYFSAEPRLSLRALITDRFSVKTSYSAMSQYIHLLCNSNLSLPSELWVPVTENIRPMRSRQVSGGAFYDICGLEFSLEGYYKTMDNVLEYKDGASFFGVSSQWEEKVCMGCGWSYGLEFLVQKKSGGTTGWIGYTLSKSMRQFNRSGNVINNGEPFPARSDRPHNLSATINQKLGGRVELSATFVYASGQCGSLALDEYKLVDISGAGERAGGLYNNLGNIGTYLPCRNNYRMPSYSRLDVGVNFRNQKKHGVSVWNISAYNVCNRQNPFMVVVGKKSVFDEKSGKYKFLPVLKQVSIFPIIPSISYTFKF